MMQYSLTSLQGALGARTRTLQMDIEEEVYAAESDNHAG